jgi:thymidylate synthase (FAD)
MRIYNDDVGEVRYIASMGYDSTPARSARVSYHDQSTSSPLQMTDRDVKLIEYLVRRGETSPFSHCAATLKMSVPLFVRSQIMESSGFTFTEEDQSTAPNISFWMPEELRDCDDDETVEESDHWLQCWSQHHTNCAAFYELMLASGVAKSQARAVLPQSLYSHFWMSGNLNSWVKFLRLRLDPHTQPETLAVAKAVRFILMKHFPISLGALLGELAHEELH